MPFGLANMPYWKSKDKGLDLSGGRAAQNGRMAQARGAFTGLLHLDQSVNMIGCEVEAVEVEASEGRPAGLELQKALPCDPTALAHAKALQPCHFPQSLCTT